MIRFYLFLNIAEEERRIFLSFHRCSTLEALEDDDNNDDNFLAKAKTKQSERRNIFDGIVLIKILFKLHAFEKTVESGKWRGRWSKQSQSIIYGFCWLI
jgi:hypothetical protein